MPIVYDQNNNQLWQDENGNITPNLPFDYSAGDAALGHAASQVGNITQNLPFGMDFKMGGMPTEQQLTNMEQQHPIASFMGGAGMSALNPSHKLRLPGYVLDAGLGALQAREGENPLVAGVSAIAGREIGDMAGRLWNRFRKGPDPQKYINTNAERSAQEFEAAGGTTTPAMKTGSETLKQLETGAATRPLTSGRMADVNNQNRQLFNEKMARAAGLPDGALGDGPFDSEALDQAFKLSGKQFEDIISQVGDATLPADMTKGLADDVWKKADLAWLKKQGIDIDALKTEGIEMDMTGDELISLRSGLRSARDGAKGNKKNLISSYIDDLDDLIEANAPEGLRGEYARVRDQYRILKQIDAPGMMNEELGIQPGRVWNKLGRDKSPLLDELNEFNKHYNKSQFTVQGNPSRSAISLLNSPYEAVKGIPEAMIYNNYLDSDAGGLLGGALQLKNWTKAATPASEGARQAAQMAGRGMLLEYQNQ